MVICFPGHPSLSFVLAVIRNGTKTSEGEGLKQGSLSNQKISDELTT